MKTVREKQYEYDKFQFEFMHKIQEIQRDYNKLSYENKYRVKNELEKKIALYGNRKGSAGIITILVLNIRG